MTGHSKWADVKAERQREADELIEKAAAILHDEDCTDGDTSDCGRWNSGDWRATGSGMYQANRHRDYYRERAAKFVGGLSALIINHRETITARAIAEAERVGIAAVLARMRGEAESVRTSCPVMSSSLFDYANMIENITP